MSFDLNVFTRSHEFPESEFLSLLADLGATDERGADQYGRHWRTVIDESAIFCNARELRTDDGVGYAHGHKWRVGVSVNSGCTPRARWAQFAVLFRSLILIPDSVAYDPQSGVFFDDADHFVGFAQDALPRWPKLVRQLRRVDLVSPEGRPRF